MSRSLVNELASFSILTRVWYVVANCWKMRMGFA